MSNDLEELARRGREDKAAREEDGRARDASDAAREARVFDREQRRLLDVSLGYPTMVTNVSWGAAMLSAIALVFLYIDELSGLMANSLPLAVVGLLVVVGSFWVGVALGYRLRRKGQIRWMARLPFRFDHEAYVETLSHGRTSSSVRVSVRFASGIERGDKELILDAIHGAVEVEHAKWKSSALEIVSRPMSTYVIARGDTPSHYINALPHKWFRLLVEDGLLTIHGRFPLTKVSCEVE